MIPNSCSPNPSEWEGFKNQSKTQIKSPDPLKGLSMTAIQPFQLEQWVWCCWNLFGVHPNLLGSTDGAEQSIPSQWLQSEKPAETIPCFIWDLQNSRKDQQSNTTKVNWKANSVLSTLPDWPRTCRMLWMCSKCKEWGKHRKMWGRKLLQG